MKNVHRACQTVRRLADLPDKRVCVYFVSQVNVNIFKKSTQMIEWEDTFSVGTSSIDEEHMESNKAIIVNEHNDNIEKNSDF